MNPLSVRSGVALPVSLLMWCCLARAQPWVRSTAPSNAWTSVASSADGNQLVAVAANGPIYLSTNSGASWQPSAAPNADWSSVTASADGRRLAVVAGGAAPWPGAIFTSSDGGTTWTPNNAPATNWSAVASSADGSTLVAVVNGGGIYTWHAPRVVPGTVLWTYDAGSSISSSPAMAPDGTIYFGTASGLVAITNAPTGASNKWTFTVGQGVSSSPSVASDGTVCFLNPGVGCYALNPDGSIKWSYPFQATGLSSPAVGADGTTYVVGNGSLYALTSNGQMKWAYNISSQDGSPVIGRDGTIYLATGSSLYGIYPDGTQKWANIGGGASTGESAAVGADGTVYMTRGVLGAWGPDGTLLWATTNTSFNTSSPVIARDGTLLVVDNPSRNLCAVSAAGQVLWIAAVGIGR